MVIISHFVSHFIFIFTVNLPRKLTTRYAVVDTSTVFYATFLSGHSSNL